VKKNTNLKWAKKILADNDKLEVLKKGTVAHTIALGAVEAALDFAADQIKARLSALESDGEEGDAAVIRTKLSKRTKK
jgi:hypothetical protein